MARTEKLRQSQLELQAGQAGESATQRSHESLMSTRHRNADRAQNARQFDSTIEQRNLDRYQRQWEERRQARSERDAIRAKNQAQKPRTTNFGGDGYLAGQERKPSGDARVDESARQFDQRQAQQSQQFQQSQAQQSQQFETKTDLSAASQGLERENPRLQALQQEMSQRQQEQMGQPTEQGGKRGFVPTEAAKEKSSKDANLDERNMRVKEANAAANMQRAATSYEKLGAEMKAATTKSARADIKAKRKLVEDTLMQPIKSDSSRLDRFMKGDQTDADLQTLRAMLRDVPPVGISRALHDEVNSGEIGPNVTRFLTEKVAASAIEFIYATGKLPDGNLVDFSSAGMQEFSKRAMEARQLLLPNTVAGQLLTKEQVEKIKRGYQDHIEMIHKLGALLIMKNQPTMPMGATTGEQEPTHEQRRADPSQPYTPAELSGQITPAGAAAKGGRAYGPDEVPKLETPEQRKSRIGPDPGDPYSDLPGLPGSLGGYQ